MSDYIDFRSETAKLLRSNPQQNIFLLLDHGGLPGLSQQLQHCSAERVSLFDKTKEDGALAVAPILVLAATEEKITLSRLIFDWLGQNGTYSSSVMILVSPFDLTCLASQLAARLHITLAGGVEAMLRFFDPRVFENLLNIMTQEQAGDFLGIVSSWHYVDRAGRIKLALENNGEVKQSSRAISLSQEQEDRLLEASEIDQILNSLRSSVPDPFFKIPYESQYDFVLESVMEARNEKLGSVLQKSLYTVIRLLNIKALISTELYQNAMDYLRSNDVENLKILLSKGEVDI